MIIQSWPFWGNGGSYYINILQSLHFQYWKMGRRQDLWVAFSQKKYLTIKRLLQKVYENSTVLNVFSPFSPSARCLSTCVDIQLVLQQLRSQGRIGWREVYCEWKGLDTQFHPHQRPRLRHSLLPGTEHHRPSIGALHLSDRSYRYHKDPFFPVQGGDYMANNSQVFYSFLCVENRILFQLGQTYPFLMVLKKGTTLFCVYLQRCASIFSAKGGS